MLDIDKLEQKQSPIAEIPPSPARSSVNKIDAIKFIWVANKYSLKDVKYTSFEGKFKFLLNWVAVFLSNYIAISSSIEFS